jgi:ABC-type branched-subunit amino acid transport system permease subunit
MSEYHSGATSASQAGSVDPDAPQSAASKLFDIRLLIGGLFTLYGLMLTIAGFFTSDTARQKASGININLWLGIGMLVLGLLFLLWRQLNPLRIEPHAVDPRAQDRA